jgi:endonuclease III-like uncharacterized protein
LFYTEVDELQMHGIGVADIHKLKSAGVCTVRVSFIYTIVALYIITIDAKKKGVQMMTRKSLLKIKGLSETKVDKIKEAAIKSQVCIIDKQTNK